MNQHNVQERKLKSDIHFKNELRRDLATSLHQLHSWQEKLHTLKNTRKEKKLNTTVARYASYIHELKQYLVPVLDDLETRIKTEMDFSKEEIAQFTEEVKAETVQAAEARKAFDKARSSSTTPRKPKRPIRKSSRPQGTHTGRPQKFRLESAELEECPEGTPERAPGQGNIQEGTQEDNGGTPLHVRGLVEVFPRRRIIDRALLTAASCLLLSVPFIVRGRGISTVLPVIWAGGVLYFLLFLRRYLKREKPPGGESNRE